MSYTSLFTSLPGTELPHKALKHRSECSGGSTCMILDNLDCNLQTLNRQELDVVGRPTRDKHLLPGSSVSHSTHDTKYCI